MKVKELIKKLEQIKDKTLPIRVQSDDMEVNIYLEDNQWVNDVELHNAGDSGYEIKGEVTLLTSV